MGGYEGAVVSNRGSTLFCEQRASAAFTARNDQYVVILVQFQDADCQGIAMIWRMVHLCAKMGARDLCFAYTCHSPSFGVVMWPQNTDNISAIVLIHLYISDLPVF